MGPLAAIAVGALAPVVTKGITSIFGLDELSDEEKRANAMREAALSRLQQAASGQTASPAQLAALAQQQRTQQALAGLAQKGSVQQRAGNVRAAMQAAPEVMAQQGAVAAQTRAEEMARARESLSQAQLGVAAQQAAAAERKRAEQRGLIGSAIQGGAQAGVLSMMADQTPKTGNGVPSEYQKLNEEAKTAATTPLNLNWQSVEQGGGNLYGQDPFSQFKLKLGS